MKKWSMKNEEAVYVLENNLQNRHDWNESLNMAIEALKRDGEARWYYVALIAEDESHGYVLLTEEEAIGAKKASNLDNWRNSSINPWSGSFFIDIERSFCELPKFSPEEDEEEDD